MINIRCRTVAVCAASLLFLSFTARTQSPPERGRVEFAVRVTPSSGVAEPARGLPVFLLSKSYHEIQREAEEQTPRPDLDAFVDGLKFGPELKEWMKKNRSVTISGEAFHKALSPDDLFRIPEFMDAYVKSNLTDLSPGFPEPKYKADDRTRNPKKYEERHKAYEIQLGKYLAKHPDSKEGMDTILGQVDPSKPWSSEMRHWHERAHARALELAQSEYLAAKTETTLDGRGAFEAAPGHYWLTTLDGEALGGEMHLRWDVAVDMRSGESASVELANLNAVKKP